jgi:hypothetical protein
VEVAAWELTEEERDAIRAVGYSGAVAILDACERAEREDVEATVTAAVAGDVVLLYAQTDPTENGPCVVGGVAAGVAALTRPAWWAAGTVCRPRHRCADRTGSALDDMDSIRRRALAAKEFAEAASRGPWTTEEVSDGGEERWYVDHDTNPVANTYRKDDALFIVHARTDVPQMAQDIEALCDLVECLRQDSEDLRRLLDQR